ncbi:MAG TPA: hypothetical protein VF551_08755, partial [Chthoniobacterales bacterium]
SFPDVLTRTEALSAVIGNAPAPAQPALAALIAQLTAPERDHLLPQVFAEWTTNDPKAVAQFMSQNAAIIPAGSVATLISEWAEDDRAAAKAWLESEPSFSTDAGAIALLRETRSQKDPGARF